MKPISVYINQKKRFKKYLYRASKIKNPKVKEKRRGVTRKAAGIGLAGPAWFPHHPVQRHWLIPEPRTRPWGLT